MEEAIKSIIKLAIEGEISLEQATKLVYALFPKEEDETKDWSFIGKKIEERIKEDFNSIFGSGKKSTGKWDSIFSVIFSRVENEVKSWGKKDDEQKKEDHKEDDEKKKSQEEFEDRVKEEVHKWAKFEDDK